MEGRDNYLEELESLTQDLYKDYQNSLHHYYEQYVKNKMKEGLSRYEVTSGMADPKSVAERWKIYEKLDRLKGIKKNGAGQYIKMAMEQQLLASKYYIGGLMSVILKTVTFPFILFIILGATLLVNPAIGTFFVSTVLVDKPELMVLFLVAFITFILYVTVKYALKFKDYFIEEMIDRTISGCDLKDFSKERYIKKEDRKVVKLSEKKESVDFVIRE